ncbi:hypothetical protein HDU81_000716 [Chytriomyces hyalinus]|nr:hypothetical protein HDU81_000716 [Chytriomyces hyalinus]
MTVLAVAEDLSALGCAIKNHLLSISDWFRVPELLEMAWTDAVYASHLQCLEALLNDPFKRITALALKANLPMAVLLVQRGVLLDFSEAAFESEFLRQLLRQPGVDPSYLSYVLLLDSIYKYQWGCSTARHLLTTGRVTITMNNYAPVRIALGVRNTEHVLLFLQFADDEEPFRIVQDDLDMLDTPADFRDPLMEGIVAIRQHQVIMKIKRPQLISVE